MPLHTSVSPAPPSISAPCALRPRREPPRGISSRAESASRDTFTPEVPAFTPEAPAFTPEAPAFTPEAPWDVSAVVSCASNAQLGPPPALPPPPLANESVAEKKKRRGRIWANCLRVHVKKRGSCPEQDGDRKRHILICRLPQLSAPCFFFFFF